MAAVDLGELYVPSMPPPGNRRKDWAVAHKGGDALRCVGRRASYASASYSARAGVIDCGTARRTVRY
jgi:hypothetical protein